MPIARFSHAPTALFTLFLIAIIPALARADGHEKDALPLTLTGQMDVQYDLVDADDKRGVFPRVDATRDEGDRTFLQDVPSFNNTQKLHLRRMRIGARFDIDHDMRVDIGAGLDLYNPGGEYSDRRDYIDRAVFSWRVDGPWGGTARAGYDKVRFGLEEMTPSSELKTIERSIATFYFTGFTLWDEEGGRPNGHVCTPLGFGGRHSQIAWEGRVAGIPQLSYALALVGDAHNPLSTVNGGRRIDPNYYAALAYEGKREGIAYTLGVNGAYRPKGVAYFPIEEQNYASSYALNPYIQATGARWSMMAELFYANSTHGQFITGGFTDDDAATRAANAPDAKGLGFNVQISSQLAEGLDAVWRYSWLDTGGAGFSSGYFSDVVPNSPITYYSSNFDKAQAIYAGLSYAWKPERVRFSLGYEWIDASDDLIFNEVIDNNDTMVTDAEARRLFRDSELTHHTLRARMQVLF